MPPHRRRNNFTVISYHYDAVTLRRTEFIETTIGEHGQEGGIEERPVQLRSFVGDNVYAYYSWSLANSSLPNLSEVKDASPTRAT